MPKSGTASPAKSSCSSADCFISNQPVLKTPQCGVFYWFALATVYKGVFRDSSPFGFPHQALPSGRCGTRLRSNSPRAFSFRHSHGSAALSDCSSPPCTRLPESTTGLQTGDGSTGYSNSQTVRRDAQDFEGLARGLSERCKPQAQLSEFRSAPKNSSAEGIRRTRCREKTCTAGATLIAISYYYYSYNPIYLSYNFVRMD